MQDQALWICSFICLHLMIITQYTIEQITSRKYTGQITEYQLFIGCHYIFELFYMFLVIVDPPRDSTLTWVLPHIDASCIPPLILISHTQHFVKTISYLENASPSSDLLHHVWLLLYIKHSIMHHKEVKASHIHTQRMTCRQDKFHLSLFVPTLYLECCLCGFYL